MPYIAVLTTDIVHSTGLEKENFNRVTGAVEKQMNFLSDREQITYYELYRGDSAQAIIPNPVDALKIAFSLKTTVNRLLPHPHKKKIRRGQSVSFDIRAAIGLGEVESSALERMTNESPFVRSGKELDRITKQKLTLGVSSGKEEMDRELSTELYLYEWIMQQWSLQAARVVHRKLEGLREREIADEFGISQSAVNQHSHAAHWNGLNRILNRYEELISVHFG
jgi:hypothetical protein